MVHGVVLGTLAVLVGLTLAMYTSAPRIVGAARAYLDAEAPIADPDVVVIHSNGRSPSVERYARDFARAKGAGSVVLLGEPFSPDEMSRTRASRRVPSLLALGIPQSALVEVYSGEDLWEELAALRSAAEQRGWRRVMFLTTPGDSKRRLLGGARMLGASGVAVGQRLFADEEPTDELWWWRDPQERTLVLYNLLLFGLGKVAGRY